MTAKSDRAQELLNDPLFQEALAGLRNSYRDAVFSDGITDEEANELRRMEFLTHKLETHLKQIIQDGKLEDFRASEQEKQALGDRLWPNRSRH